MNKGRRYLGAKNRPAPLPPKQPHKHRNRDNKAIGFLAAYEANLKAA